MNYKKYFLSFFQVEDCLLNVKKKVTKTVIDLLILFFGLIGYYCQYYIMVFYAVLHFVVIIAQYFSQTFTTKLNNFKQDQETIKNHYIESFKYIYYLVFISRMVISGFYIYFFMLQTEDLHSLSNAFFMITYAFIVIGFIDLGITLYIIFFKNNPVIEVAMNVCYHCVTKGGVVFLALHTSSNALVFEPNPVSNCYQKYSPVGRGYGAWSSGQLIQIDMLKTQLGGEFNYRQVVDHNNMLDPKRIKAYCEQHNISYKNLLANAKPKPG
jgi:hypothetical protein